MTRLTRYSWFTLAFNLAVILLGALVRATGSGAGCGRSWPTCQGEVIPDLAGATAVEYTHRAASGIALVLVAVLVAWTWRSIPKGEPARTGAVLALASIIGESLIGAMIVLAEWVAEDASTARVVAVPLHLVNTLFLLAALTLTTLIGVAASGWIDRPFPGFFVLVNRVIPSVGLPHWTGSRDGTLYQRTVVGIDGRPVVDPADVYRQVERQPIGTPVTYELRHGSATETLAIASSVFSRTDYWTVFGTYLCTGLFYLILGLLGITLAAVLGGAVMMFLDHSKIEESAKSVQPPAVNLSQDGLEYKVAAKQ